MKGEIGRECEENGERGSQFLNLQQKFEELKIQVLASVEEEQEKK